MRLLRTLDVKDNLCDSCSQSFAECDPDCIEFGNGVGNDNVSACSNCTCPYPYSGTDYPGELMVKGTTPCEDCNPMNEPLCTVECQEVCPECKNYKSAEAVKSYNDLTDGESTQSGAIRQARG